MTTATLSNRKIAEQIVASDKPVTPAERELLVKELVIASSSYFQPKKYATDIAVSVVVTAAVIGVRLLLARRG